MMLTQQKRLIVSNFRTLVHDCDLKYVLNRLEPKDASITKMLKEIAYTSDHLHNNRLILWDLMELDSSTAFHNLVLALKINNFPQLANKLLNLPDIELHKTCCFERPPDEKEDEEEHPKSTPLEIQVTYAQDFRGSDYHTRSKNRGQLLLINNIKFEGHEERQAAHVDKKNLTEMFTAIGFKVDTFTNLTKDEMEIQIKKFASHEYSDEPDICAMIIMSHGDRIDKRAVVISVDGNFITEDWIVKQFSNQACVSFRNKPKILIFHICRGAKVDDFKHLDQHTQSDSWCRKEPLESGRSYSDIIICHPSIDGYKAHRDVMRGSWYIEALCEVFMKHSHELHVESMLKKIDELIQKRRSERNGRQTSTFENIAFKDCYLNPGIYANENGDVVQFNEATTVL